MTGRPTWSRAGVANRAQTRRGLLNLARLKMMRSEPGQGLRKGDPRREPMPPTRKPQTWQQVDGEGQGRDKDPQ